MDAEPTIPRNRYLGEEPTIPFSSRGMVSELVGAPSTYEGLGITGRTYEGLGITGSYGAAPTAGYGVGPTAVSGHYGHGSHSGHGSHYSHGPVSHTTASPYGTVRYGAVPGATSPYGSLATAASQYGAVRSSTDQ